MPRVCLACHREIGWLVERNRGLHARERATPCQSCHPDHAGRDFALVSWKEGAPERFDHQRAGFRLELSHAKAKCEACHAAKYRVSPAAALAPQKGAHWTGLETGCTACHEDVHQGALDKDCTKCHDAGKWVLAPGFDHKTTRYPLTGAHDTVSCDGCHLAKRLPLRLAATGKPIPVYKPLQFGECSSCHADPHKGKFGAECSSCHVTASFRKIDKDNFDHEKTRYPLRGKHAAVACAKCHAPGDPAGKKPPFARCADCHRDDPHAGTAKLAGAVADCASCHKVEGWTPATYTVADHDRAPYRLEGRHREVRCAECHQKRPPGVPAAVLGSAGVQLRPASKACRDCHADDHGGQLAQRPDKGACEACHRVAGWDQTTYGIAEHAKLRLPLDGKHATIRCGACHAADRKGLPGFANVAALGKARVLMKLASAECASCHVDVHDGRFAQGGERAKPEGCAACHDARAFRPSTVAAAQHERYAFRLEGAHRATPCVACHADLKTTAGGSFLLAAARKPATPLALAVAKRDCADCHASESPHGDQFAGRKDRGACEACHSVAAFAPADRFDHDRDASFSLAGAHARVPCAKCHVPDAQAAARGGVRVRYRPLSGKCESCHDDATARRPTR